MCLAPCGCFNATVIVVALAFFNTIITTTKNPPAIIITINSHPQLHKKMPSTAPQSIKLQYPRRGIFPIKLKPSPSESEDSAAEY